MSPAYRVVITFLIAVLIVLIVTLVVVWLASCTPEPCVVGVIVNSQVHCMPVR